MADANAIVRDVLASGLSGVPVSTELPPGRPRGPYAMVSRTGGADGEHLDRPIMAIMCWAGSDAAAYSLAMGCRDALVVAAEEHPLLSAAETISLSRDEWAATGAARYMLEMQLTINKE